MNFSLLGVSAWVNVRMAARERQLVITVLLNPHLVVARGPELGQRGPADSVALREGAVSRGVLCTPVALGRSIESPVVWVSAEAKATGFPSACFYVIRNHGQVNIR
jgi:hypothetical protein